MKQITCYRAVMWTFVLLTMLAIFIFSAQNGEDSTKLSDKIVNVVDNTQTSSISSTSSDLVSDGTPQSPPLLSSERLTLTKIIRKSAHVLIYATLGFFLMGAFVSYKGKWYVHILLSIIAGTIYAASDEWHQTFVPGRNGRLADVGIDLIGITIGVTVMFLIVALVNKIKSKKASA